MSVLRKGNRGPHGPGSRARDGWQPPSMGLMVLPACTKGSSSFPQQSDPWGATAFVLRL